ncbi:MULTISPECIES: stage III sporulation protein AG [unclassified Bacillus (in: firmicutes)]|uniref:stage III sporulation protein AG n=1 Tax=unclassified Bacillus (in: firmicutes) TaxID=185979 RepID=UPI0008E1EEF5|nr:MULTISPECIES: stage III sporulation protein AG [unclassified Bacillus (in: firmicutes)]SFA96728.1 stage III sporulation protein AG [Bacillus sp. UNCCL13]SFQ79995.1 stage III sporulation protein AG [Bacillus sp. cl95]
MDIKNGFQNWIKKLLEKDGHPDPRKGKFQYLLLALAIGAAIMLISNLFGNNNVDPNSTTMPVYQNEKTSGEDVEVFGQKKSSEHKTISDYEHSYETQLKDALETILGVDDVTVVVNIDSTEKKILEKNKVSKSQTTDETDREGGQRKVQDTSEDQQIVIIRNGEKEVPIVIETKKPEIRGVLVVARGADNIQVKKWIIESVTRALDVPSHRVAVMPKKSKGD